MVDTEKYPLSDAAWTQLLGVSMALLGCAGVFFGSGQWKELRVRIGTGLPFLIAYGITLCALCVSRRIDKPPVGKETYKRFVLCFLFVDAILLSIMVYFSGGVKQSLFCPLFFVIPAMAVVFVRWGEEDKSEEDKYTWGVMAVTVAGYLLVYWLPVEELTPGRFYRFCECTILVLAVALTVVTSLRMRSLP